MKKSNYLRTIYAIDGENTYTAQTKSLLSALPISIPLHSAEEVFHHLSHDKHKIILFNYQDHKLLAPYINESICEGSNIETIVFNVPFRIHTEKLLTLGNLKGVFYQQESNEKLQCGLQAIIDGQNWLPRQVTSQLLHYYRHLFRNQTLKATIELTAREIQILRSLQTGASNQQMAEHLFISEFTVKSHLYQIFKKISVKNRTQAISWANHHLVSQMSQ